MSRGSIYLNGRAIPAEGLVTLRVKDRIELLGESLAFVVEYGTHGPGSDA